LRNHVTHIFAARLAMDEMRWDAASAELAAALRDITRMGAGPQAWIARLHAATQKELEARRPGGTAGGAKAG
jgi:hypothetical protein